MLVLTRGIRERVLIRCGKEIIVVELTDVDRNRVRMGFSASPDVLIYREEVAPAELRAELAILERQ